MIKTEQLKFGYKSKSMLFKQLNLNIQQGKVYGLLGHNGAGKTTMLKLLTGLLFPKSGTCSVMEFNPKERHPDFLKQIFYVPEEFEFPPLTIEKYIKTFSVFYPDYDQDIMDNILNEFELPYTHKITNLSFGQKKKFLLAFAISTNCKILLMDEPTNGLDIPSKSKFRKIIASFISDERTFIISTHQVRDLDNILDSILIIEKGEVIFNHDMEEIHQKLNIKKIPSLELEDDVLYSEKELGGYHVLTKNTGEEETKIDIEMLYKAVNTNKEIIHNAFKYKTNEYK